MVQIFKKVYIHKLVNNFIWRRVNIFFWKGEIEIYTALLHTRFFQFARFLFFFSFFFFFVETGCRIRLYVGWGNVFEYHKWGIGRLDNDGNGAKISRETRGSTLYIQTHTHTHSTHSSSSFISLPFSLFHLWRVLLAVSSVTRPPRFVMLIVSNSEHHRHVYFYSLSLPSVHVSLWTSIHEVFHRDWKKKLLVTV